MALLTVDDLTVTFQTEKGSVRALQSASFELGAGEILIVIGESGSGKTVLAEALLRILPANARITGRVTLESASLLDLSESNMQEIRRRDIAWIPQGAGSALNPVRRVGSVLTEIAVARGVPRDRSQEVLEEAFGVFDLDFKEIGKSYPHELSGGMQQRVINAAALLGDPRLVIADEPTYGLDADLVKSTADYLRRFTAKGAGLLVITHDLRLAERLGGTLALIYGSYIVENRPTADFFLSPAHPYGEGLLRALPEKGSVPIPGSSPELQRLPTGCPFAPRCSRRIARCDQQVPDMVPVHHATLPSDISAGQSGNADSQCESDATGAPSDLAGGKVRCVLYA